MMKKAVLLVGITITCILLSSCAESNSATPDSASKKAEETTTLTTMPAPTTVPPTTVPPTTVHTHQWEDVKSIVHHDAVTEKVWVVDKPESVKTITKTTAVCNICGMKFTYITGAEPDYNNMMQHESSERQLYDLQRQAWKLGAGKKPVIHPKMIKTVDYSTETVPEEGHYENQVTKEAYDETVITGQKCKTCGEYKAK